MKNKCLSHFYSAYKSKYSARMFVFASVEFLLLCGLNAAHLAGCTTERKNTINTTLTKTTYGPHQQLHLSTEISVNSLAKHHLTCCYLIGFNSCLFTALLNSQYKGHQALTTHRVH